MAHKDKMCLICKKNGQSPAMRNLTALFFYMKIVSMTTNFHEINRTEYLQAINDRFGVNSVVALLGPRQCGKTTLARAFLQQANPDIEATWSKANYFDLENYQDLQRLADPLLTLKPLRGLIVI